MVRNGKVAGLAAAVLVIAGCAKDYNMPHQAKRLRAPVNGRPVSTVVTTPPPKILPDTHFAAGRLLERQGAIARAIVQYRKVIALNHNHVGAYHRLAVLLSNMGEHAEAAKFMKRAVAIAPGRAELCNDLGVEFMFMERWTEAEAQFRQAAELQPEFARAHINLGMMLSSLGRFAEALTSFQAVLPDSDAWYNVGLLYRGQSRYAEAADAFHKALSFDENFAAAQTQLDQIAPHLTVASTKKTTDESTNELKEGRQAADLDGAITGDFGDPVESSWSLPVESDDLEIPAVQIAEDERQAEMSTWTDRDEAQPISQSVPVATPGIDEETSAKGESAEKDVVVDKPEVLAVTAAVDEEYVTEEDFIEVDDDPQNPVNTLLDGIEVRIAKLGRVEPSVSGNIDEDKIASDELYTPDELFVGADDEEDVASYLTEEEFVEDDTPSVPALVAVIETVERPEVDDEIEELNSLLLDPSLERLVDYVAAANGDHQASPSEATAMTTPPLTTVDTVDPVESARPVAEDGREVLERVASIQPPCEVDRIDDLLAHAREMALPEANRLADRMDHESTEPNGAAALQAERMETLPIVGDEPSSGQYSDITEAFAFDEHTSEGAMSELVVEADETPFLVVEELGADEDAREVSHGWLGGAVLADEDFRFEVPEFGWNELVTTVDGVDFRTVALTNDEFDETLSSQAEGLILGVDGVWLDTTIGQSIPPMIETAMAANEDGKRKTYSTNWNGVWRELETELIGVRERIECQDRLNHADLFGVEDVSESLDQLYATLHLPSSEIDPVPFVPQPPTRASANRSATMVASSTKQHPSPHTIQQESYRYAKRRQSRPRPSMGAHVVVAAPAKVVQESGLVPELFAPQSPWDDVVEEEPAFVSYLDPWTYAMLKHDGWPDNYQPTYPVTSEFRDGFSGPVRAAANEPADVDVPFVWLEPLRGSVGGLDILLNDVHCNEHRPAEGPEASVTPPAGGPFAWLAPNAGRDSRRHQPFRSTITQTHNLQPIEAGIVNAPITDRLPE